MYDRRLYFLRPCFWADRHLSISTQIVADVQPDKGLWISVLSYYLAVCYVQKLLRYFSYFIELMMTIAAFTIISNGGRDDSEHSTEGQNTIGFRRLTFVLADNSSTRCTDLHADIDKYHDARG